MGFQQNVVIYFIIFIIYIILKLPCIHLYHSSSSQILNCFKPKVHNFLMINDELDIFKKKILKIF